MSQKSLNLTRYNGIFKYHVYQLYHLYAQGYGYGLDGESLMRVLMPILGDMSWDITGNFLSDADHMKMASAYLQETQRLNADDALVLHHVSEALSWEACMHPSSAYAKADSCGSPAPVFYNLLTLPNTKDQMYDLLSSHRGILEFLDMFQDRPHLPVLSALTGLSLGARSRFNYDLANLGLSSFLSQIAPPDYPEGAVPAPGGYYLQESYSREFISYPAELTIAPFQADTFLPYRLGLTGYFFKPTKNCRKKFFGMDHALMDYAFDADPSKDEFTHLLDGYSFSPILFESFQDIPHNRVCLYSVPSDWELEKFQW